MADTRSQALSKVRQGGYNLSHINAVELLTHPQLANHRDWLENRRVDLKHTYSAEDDSFHSSRFQHTRHLIAVRPDPEHEGMLEPWEDRVVVDEADHFHGIAYDIDEQGNYYIPGVISPRPYIQQEGPAVLCWDIPMGFAMFGEGSKEVFEATDDAAKRKIMSELGLPMIDPPVLLRTLIDHTTYSGLTRTPVYKVRVDRHSVVGKTDDDDNLVSEVITLAEYGQRVRRGIDDDGVLYGFGLSQGSFGCFLASEGADAIRQFYGF